MKNLYTAAIILLTFVNAAIAQQISAPQRFRNQGYLSNNLGAAEEAYRKPTSGLPGFFQFPVNDRSAYDKMIAREMSSTASFGDPPLNEAAAGLDYDVKYYRLNLRINPDTAAGKYIRGNITTYFTTLPSNFNQVRFDFSAALICDSVYYQGVKLPAGNKVEIGDTLQITIPTIAVAGTLDSITVYYRGVPPVVTDFGGSTGYVRLTHGSPAQNYIYTLSEPYSASTWWPCKSRIVSDKADSVDIIVSTPSSFRVAANGIVASETINGSNRSTFYKHRYPISSYQVCLGIANYVQQPASATMVNINGTMMPYYNLLFPETNTANAATALNRTPLMLTTFSTLFGDYPFKNEKYGHYTFGFSGGMEHNTFSGMGPTTYDQTTDWSVIAHELGHQWWGAAVTCGSWRDIWVNESFARYSEIACLEFAPSVSATTALSHRTSIKASAISPANQAESTYQTDTTSISTIFSPSVYIYDRGAMIISMLRTVLGDAKFFQALQNYQADPNLKYKSAFTDDVRSHMEAVSGLDLSRFFSDWIYNRGFANYNTAKWNSSGNQLILLLPQATEFSPLSSFEMPVVVRVQGSNPVTMDTTIVLYDKQGILHTVNNGVLTSTGANLVQFNLSFAPTTISFDPFRQVLANGSIMPDPTLTI
ncbi:MAG: M1 family metallopeptidase, partial [Gloeobacteraceae cyanobacterium ES-bin-316]|nr:M1 family metallopeptidase [Ferruginibacter sp.]